MAAKDASEIPVGIRLSLPYSRRRALAARKKLYYRLPAYLLTTDPKSSAKQLLQIYLDRWQIEVNHREEKDTLGQTATQFRSILVLGKN
jgi:hypothetical protein